MNGRTGLCVPKDGSYAPEWGVGVGAGWYRFSADLDYGAPREWAQACKNAGLKLFMSYDSDTFRHGNDDKAVHELSLRYRGLIDIVGVGNEPDGAGAESSKMTHARINRLMEISRYYWGDAQMLAGPGLISGDETWLDGFDFTHCNYIDVHWYGQWSPEVTVPDNVPFNGTLDQIMQRYYDRARQLAGRYIPIVSSESGLSTNEVSKADQATYVGSTVAYALKREDIVQMHTIFAFHDHAGFGLIRKDGTWKPSCNSYMLAANGIWTPELQAIQLAMCERATAEAAAWRGEAAA